MGDRLGMLPTQPGHSFRQIHAVGVRLSWERNLCQLLLIPRTAASRRDQRIPRRVTPRRRRGENNVMARCHNRHSEALYRLPQALNVSDGEFILLVGF